MFTIVKLQNNQPQSMLEYQVTLQIQGDCKVLSNQKVKNQFLLYLQNYLESFFAPKTTLTVPVTYKCYPVTVSYNMLSNLPKEFILKKLSKTVSGIPYRNVYTTDRNKQIPVKEIATRKLCSNVGERTSLHSSKINPSVQK